MAMQTTAQGIGSATLRLCGDTRKKSAANGVSLDTLAQLDQSPASGRPNQQLNLQKRARAKFITTPLAVSLAELRTDLEKSYRNSVYCASVIQQHGEELASRYCGNRWCLVCNRIRTARAISAYLPILHEWASPHMVTLTVRNCAGADLAGVLDGMMAAFTSCKRSIRRTEGLSFRALRKTECTYNVARDDYHPHFHVIVEGPEQAELLRAKWLERFPDEAAARGQDVRPCDDRGLMEVFKYFTKLTTKARDGQTRRITPAQALDVIFVAMRGRRVWQPVGFQISGMEDERIEGEAVEVVASPAFKRLTENVLWLWEQDCADWIDHSSGELLSEYTVPQKLRRFVEQAQGSGGLQGRAVGPFTSAEREALADCERITFGKAEGGPPPSALHAQ